MARPGIAAKTPRRRCLGVFVKHNGGATAVEFALIALPFFAILVAMIQTFFLFFAQSVLENAVRRSARQLLTGQFQAQTASLSPAAAATAFTQIVCSNASVLLKCSGLMVDVEVANNWSVANFSMPALTYGANGQVSNGWQFNPGHAGDIVVVRVMYLWPVIFGPIAFNLANQPNNTRLIMASAAFQNEPANP